MMKYRRRGCGGAALSITSLRLWMRYGSAGTGPGPDPPNPFSNTFMSLCHFWKTNLVRITIRKQDHFFHGPQSPPFIPTSVHSSDQGILCHGTYTHTNAVDKMTAMNIEWDSNSVEGSNYIPLCAALVHLHHVHAF